MCDERLGQVGVHLDCADTRLGLGVQDVEPGSPAVVEADVADAQVAELAAVAEHAHDERTAGVRAPTTDMRRARRARVEIRMLPPGRRRQPRGRLAPEST